VTTVPFPQLAPRAAAAFLVSALLALAVSAAPAAARRTGAAPSHALPTVSLYLDSAAAVRALAALPVPELPEGTSPLFAVNFDATGAVDAAYGLFDQLPAAFADSVAAILRAHARPQAPSDEPVRLHFFRVVTGPDAAISAAREFVVPPELSNRNGVARLLGEVLKRHRAKVGAGARIVVKFRVLADGRVGPGSVRVIASTGDETLDRALVAVAYQCLFRPAEVERVRVNLMVAIPLLVQPPDSR
jgi:TonB family protein